MGLAPRGSVGAAGFHPEYGHRTYQFARLVLDRRPTGLAGGRADAVRRAPVRRRCRSRDAREHFHRTCRCRERKPEYGTGGRAQGHGAQKPDRFRPSAQGTRSEEHTSELQSLMRISYAVFCLKKKKKNSKIEHLKRYKSKA